MRSSWLTLAILLGLFVGTVPNPVSADTYNFFFKEKKKKAKSTVEKKVEKKESGSFESDDVKVQIKTNADGSVSEPPVVTKSTPTPVQPAAEPVSPAMSSAIESRVYLIPARVPSRVKLGVGAVGATQKFLDSSYPYGKDLSVGGMLSLGVEINGAVTLTLAGALRFAPSPSKTLVHASLDGEFFVLNGWERKYRVFEPALILGLSTMVAADDNFASLHTGLRLNINTSREFGFAVVGRGNLGFQMVELGIIRRL